MNRAGATQRVRIASVRDGKRAQKRDLVAVEEPLEIRIRHKFLEERSLGITMRTPGHDRELVAGLLYAEGIIQSRKDLVKVEACTPDAGERDYGNVVAAELAPDVVYEHGDHVRSLVKTSACGVCGSASVEDLSRRPLPRLHPTRPRVAGPALRRLPERLRVAQKAFRSTGGIHAAALFDARGRILSVREDVGRHNAVDKLVGAEFLAGRLPLAARGLLVSGRASYEILQKARVAGLGLVAAVGAPSSLAVGLAGTLGMTLVGFLKADGYNVYAGKARVTEAARNR